MYSKLIIGFFAILLLNSVTQVHGQEEEKLVILHTQSGKIVIEFFPEDAPNHVDNFIKLAESGFYDRTIFHRIIEDFMIQGGDPKTKPGAYTETREWGTGNPGYTIDAEFNDIKHNRGIVSMARSMDPNSAGSQFFIVHKDSNFLDGQYTVFGRIATQESYETLDKIATLETAPGIDIALDWGKGEILKAEVANKSEVPDLLEQGDPERVTVTPPQSLDSEYSSEKFGFSYSFPTGWLVQEPEKINPNVPDVAAIGPQTGDFPPTISVSVVEGEGKTLDERIKEVKDSLSEPIEAGQVQIISEEKTQIQGLNAHLMTLQGVFVSQSGAFTVKFNEINIEGPDKFYVLTYADTENNFENGLEQFQESLDSFTILESEEVPQEADSEEPGGGCLIATATFGSELSPQVQKLREIRDTTLLNTNSGASFINSFNSFYYSFSPTIADWERENLIFKEITKLAITPLLYTLSILNYVDINSEADMLGYGIAIMGLNLGIYVIGPLAVIIKLKPKNKQKFK